MAESNTQAAIAAQVDKLLNPPIHKHPMFDEIGISQSRVWEAADALQGIAAMMQPEISGGHQMNLATVSQAGAVFRFFGQFLQAEAEEIIHARDKIVEDLRVLDGSKHD
jgi:hypothetical protein